VCRLAFGGFMASCAVAGAGLLLAALTLQPLKPPQPQSEQGQAVHGGRAGQSLRRAEPTHIDIPAINVSARMLSLGVNEKNELAVPPIEKADQASWYKLGPSPGELGSAVILGHVDSVKKGPAVFFNVGKLKAGDVITVARKDGSKPIFKVDSVQSFPKAEFPTELVYDQSHEPTLKLITCGGDFDKKNRNYLSNVIVFATLIR
jgi:sortase (surface protein transpeptidase)